MKWIILNDNAYTGPLLITQKFYFVIPISSPKMKQNLVLNFGVAFVFFQTSCLLHCRRTQATHKSNFRWEKENGAGRLQLYWCRGKAIHWTFQQLMTSNDEDHWCHFAVLNLTLRISKCVCSCHKKFLS